jgi:hypothetical protein
MFKNRIQIQIACNSFLKNTNSFQLYASWGSDDQKYLETKKVDKLRLLPASTNSNFNNSAAVFD